MKNQPYPFYDIPVVNNLKEMVQHRAEISPDSIAFSFSKGKNGLQTKTFKQFSNEINQLGSYLYNAGYKNKHIAIIGENSYEWVLAFFAIVNGGNVVVPIDKEQPSDVISQLLEKSNCSAVIYSKSYADSIKTVENVDKICISEFQDILISGEKLIKGGNCEYTEYIVDNEKMAAIFFTSGTTGFSKGVMLSHKNMVTDIVCACKSFELHGDSISILPFHHTFGLITALLATFHYGFSSYINSSLKRVQADFALAKPTGTYMVPLFVETFYKTIIATAKKSGKLMKTLQRAEKISNMLLKINIDIRNVIFKSVHQAFGGNLKYIICGGAYLDTKYIKAFRTWGIDIYNGYGITECSPVVSVNRNCHWRDGSVGLVLDGCNVIISENNEIFVKGDNVMIGYYNDDAATKAVMTDGWYDTGDLGYVDEDGFLFLTGRKKNLIILSNGENISPEEIEERILCYDGVQEVVVYSKNNMIVAEIFPTEEYMENEEYFNSLQKKINQGQPQYKQVNKIKLRPTEFVKNSTKKILRHNFMEDNNNA